MVKDAALNANLPLGTASHSRRF